MNEAFLFERRRDCSGNAEWETNRGARWRGRDWERKRKWAEEESSVGCNEGGVNLTLREFIVK
jgi:hypothetical protein